MEPGFGKLLTSSMFIKYDYDVIELGPTVDLAALGGFHVRS